MTLSKAEIDEKLEEGAVRALITFELVGKPKKHVKETLTNYVKKLEEEKKLDVLKSHIEDVVELEGEDEGLFSSFAEVELILPDLPTLTYLAFNMMPASVEIIAPNKYTFTAGALQNLMNDVISQFHTAAMNVRAEKTKSTYLRKNIENLLQNTITLVLGTGARTQEEIKRLTGVPEEEIVRIMKLLQERKAVKKDGEKWTLS